MREKRIIELDEEDIKKAITQYVEREDTVHIMVDVVTIEFEYRGGERIITAKVSGR